MCEYHPATPVGRGAIPQVTQKIQCPPKKQFFGDSQKCTKSLQENKLGTLLSPLGTINIVPRNHIPTPYGWGDMRLARFFLAKNGGKNFRFRIFTFEIVLEKSFLGVIILFRFDTFDPTQPRCL